MALRTRLQTMKRSVATHKWRIAGVLAIVVIALAVVLGYRLFEADLVNYAMNLFTELLGVVLSVIVAVFIVDRINERGDREKQMRRLVQEAGSRSRDTAVAATERLRANGWLAGDDGLLKGANLAHANLNEAELSNANLEQANFYWASLESTDMNEANLAGAIFNGASMTGASMFNANLDGAILDFAWLHNADFRLASLRGTRLVTSRLQNADFTGAYMEGAIWVDNVLSPGEFAGATLPDGTLFHSHDDLERFVNPTSGDFESTLEAIEHQRKKLLWEE